MSIPINWCCQMIRDEMKKDGLIPYDGYSMRESVTAFHKKLFLILDYNTHPLPSICNDALRTAIITYMVATALIQQPCEHMKNDSQYITVTKLLFNF